MGRTINRLSARAVSTMATAGRHADGGGLYLVVDKSGAKRWAFLFRRNGRLREMGLGGINGVSLAEARAAAEAVRRTLAAGGDPIAERKAGEARRGEATTFGAFADGLLDDLAPGFRNAKHLAQWAMTLREYAAPLRPKRLDAIDTADVLAVLQPIWTKKPETASRLRGRIERVLDAARAKGLRSGENPARWRGHLDTLLPRRSKVERSNHAAMAFAEVPALVQRLRDARSVSAAALEFLILTAARSGEVIGARWGEIDRASNVWTVPASRMKAGREHRVPLSPRAAAIIAEMAETPKGEFVFPGARPDKPLSNMAMAMLLRRLGVGAVTVHGFRSAFRDWTGEETTFPREVAEAALAHTVGDAVERAYRRGDALEKRRRLMDAWANFCERAPASNVVALQIAGRAP